MVGGRQLNQCSIPALKKREMENRRSSRTENEKIGLYGEDSKTSSCSDCKCLSATPSTPTTAPTDLHLDFYDDNEDGSDDNHRNMLSPRTSFSKKDEQYRISGVPRKRVNYGPMVEAPLYAPSRALVSDPISAKDRGKVDLVLKCLKCRRPAFVDRFIYIRPEGEIFGSDSLDKGLTMLIEHVNLSPRHAAIQCERVPSINNWGADEKENRFFLRDTSSSEGTWIRVHNDRPTILDTDQGAVTFACGDALGQTFRIEKTNEMTLSEFIETNGLEGILMAIKASGEEADIYSVESLRKIDPSILSQPLQGRFLQALEKPFCGLRIRHSASRHHTRSLSLNLDDKTKSLNASSPTPSFNRTGSCCMDERGHTQVSMGAPHRQVLKKVATFDLNDTTIIPDVSSTLTYTPSTASTASILSMSTSSGRSSCGNSKKTLTVVTKDEDSDGTSTNENNNLLNGDDVINATMHMDMVSDVERRKDTLKKKQLKGILRSHEEDRTKLDRFAIELDDEVPVTIKWEIDEYSGVGRFVVRKVTRRRRPLVLQVPNVPNSPPPSARKMLQFPSAVWMNLGEAEVRIVAGDEFRLGEGLIFAVQRFNVGFWKDKGSRWSMEDECAIIQDLPISNAIDSSFFAVYDGHTGPSCADYLRNHLHEEIITSLKDLDKTHDVHNYIYSGLQSAFRRCDEKFLASSLGTVCDYSGATACAVLMIGNMIWCTNAGDSRAVLCRNGRAIDLSVDHVPSRMDEKMRICKAGGFVHQDRVCGRLGVSRSFGDKVYKDNNLVTSDPEIRLLERDDDDEFILIACDGLFNRFTSQGAVDFIRHGLRSMPRNEQDPRRVVQDLVKNAIYVRQTKDNVTAILITLKRSIL